MTRTGVVFVTLQKKLRVATYTAAVCKFGGDIFFVFCLVPSVAQLSSASYYFLCFPAAVQQILSLTWMVLTIFCLRGAHRPQPQ